MMKLLRRFLIGICLVVFTAVVALGLGALVPRPLFDSNPVMEVAQSSADKRRILILNNPIHTDIALPADPDVLEAFGFVSDGGLELDYPGVFWIAFGWGGRSPGVAYDAHDIFFPAVGGFNAMMGCNTWTADMLRRAGVKTGMWTPLPLTLDWSLDLHNGR